MIQRAFDFMTDPVPYLWNVELMAPTFYFQNGHSLISPAGSIFCAKPDGHVALVRARERSCRFATHFWGSGDDVTYLVSSSTCEFLPLFPDRSEPDIKDRNSQTHDVSCRGMKRNLGSGERGKLTDQKTQNAMRVKQSETSMVVCPSRPNLATKWPKIAGLRYIARDFSSFSESPLAQKGLRRHTIEMAPESSSNTPLELPASTSEYIPLSRVGALFGRSVTWGYRLVYSGHIKPFTLMNSKYVTREDVVALVRNAQATLPGRGRPRKS